MCHRCHCKRGDFLETEKIWELKTTQRIKAKVVQGAAGGGTGGRPIVHMGTDGKSLKPGKGVAGYERGRLYAGAHLMFNAFWLVSTFCLYQMYMRDSLHQVDHGIIIQILRAILRLFWGIM